MIRTICVILFSLLTSLSSIAESWLGGGTALDPYQISTVEQLQELSERVNSGSSYKGIFFRLEADLNMADSLVDCHDWIPIGSVSSPFAGVFDGNGKEIDSIIFAGGDYVGLFGYLSHTAVVKDVTLNDPSGWAGVCMGGISGLNEGTIQSCKVNGGSISDVKIIGGITGINYGVVDSCSSSCYLYSKLATGGIVGYNYGEVKNCTNQRGFDGILGTGGIVGYNGGFTHVPCNHEYHELGFVSHCINEGRVFGDTYTGGICGRNDGYVLNCGNEALVKSLYEVGGIVGVNGSMVNAEGFVYNSYNRGTVYAENSTAGAICGTNTGRGTIDNVFNSGVVVSENSDTTWMVAVDEGLAAHLYDFQMDESDSTYYEALDSVFVMLKDWADTVSLNYIYPWVFIDSILDFGLYVAPPIQTSVEDVGRADDSISESVFGGIWLADGSSVYTVKGELVYLNRSGQRRFMRLKPGVYVVNRKKILVVSD